MKLKMRKDSSKVPADSMRTDSAAETQEKKRGNTRGDTEVEELKMQIQKLNKRLEVMSKLNC